MKVKIKKLNENAVIPAYALQGDAGLDLTVTNIEFMGNMKVKYSFGLAIEIPEGYVGLIFPRSSIHKTDQLMINSVGVIDSGYRGEISAIMLQKLSHYAIGDRAAQIIIIPYPKVEFLEVETLSNTERGIGGYGSTNIKTQKP